MSAEQDRLDPGSAVRERGLAARISQIRAILAARSASPARRYRTPTLLKTENLIGLTVLLVGLTLVFIDPAIIPIQRTISPEVARFFKAITDVGDSIYILVPTGVVCLAVLLVDWSGKALAIRAGVNRAFVFCGYVFVTVAASGLFVIVLKILFGRARPRSFEQLGAYHFDLFTLGARNASFPSGHATTVAALCAALIILFPRWRLAIIAFGILGAFSRVFVGAHFPSDVILGILIGIVFAHRTAVFLAHRRIGFRVKPNGRLRAVGLRWPLVAVKKLLQNPR